MHLIVESNACSICPNVLSLNATSSVVAYVVSNTDTSLYPI